MTDPESLPAGYRNSRGDFVEVPDIAAKVRQILNEAIPPPLVTGDIRNTTTPHHGGRPAEMLREVAALLDALDDAGGILQISEGAAAGLTMEEYLYSERPNQRTVQADLRWLADQLA